jgi:hypothetical protein
MAEKLGCAPMWMIVAPLVLLMMLRLTVNLSSDPLDPQAKVSPESFGGVGGALLVFSRGGFIFDMCLMQSTKGRASHARLFDRSLESDPFVQKWEHRFHIRANL